MLEKVSIIIPSYNRATIIRETLDSVLNQTYTKWECIVVDDGSTDKTSEIISYFKQQDSRFNYFNRPVEKLKGPSACRNYGLEKATGDFVVFLDSDDLLAPYCLEERVKAFKKYANCDFLVFQMERFLSQPNYSIKKELQPIDCNNPLFAFLRLESIWQITSPIYKKEYLNKVKGFNEKLLNYEDLEFAIRCLHFSSGIKCFENKDAFYRNDANYMLKYKSNNSKDKSVRAYIVFLKAVDTKIVRAFNGNPLEFAYKDALVLAYKKVFMLNIKDRLVNYKSLNKCILKYLSANNYLSTKEKLTFYFVQYIPTRLLKTKGLGVYRLIKQLYK